MDVLGVEGAAVSGTGGDELPPQPDSEGLSAAQEETPAPAGGPLPENGAAPPEADEPLDPSLLQLFAEARNEVQEIALASELPDIPIQELLSELVSLGRRLGIRPPLSAEPANKEGSAEPECSAGPDAARPSAAGSRRHALHGVLLSLTLAMAIASVLLGADRMISSGQNQAPTPPAAATAYAGVVVRQLHPGATLDPTPGSTPTDVPTRQPAYFLYTVQRGDTLTSIAATFGISLDNIIWMNPDVIDDPNLLLVGDKLLIPNVAGMIYYVKPGDVLSAIGRLLPDQGPDDSGPPPGRRQPP